VISRIFFGVSERSPFRYKIQLRHEIFIHAPLNAPSEGVDLDVQLELFERALEELTADGDLINQVLEITLGDNDELRVLRYHLPPDNG